MVVNKYSKRLKEILMNPRQPKGIKKDLKGLKRGQKQTNDKGRQELLQRHK